MPDSIRVLYVEDNEVDRMALTRRIREEGLRYDVVVAGTVSEAMGLIKKENFDIALIDYMLPDGRGLDILARLHDIPSILITGSGDEAVAVKAMKGGAYDYLIKDPEGGYLELLSATIEKVMDKYRLEKKHKLAQENIVLQNIELRRLYSETKELSLRDPLTGLANRRLLITELEREIVRTRRYGRLLSAVMLDIDHFKDYNDTHGHLEGDRVLYNVAELLTVLIRVSDLAVRYGAEEFLVLLPETSLESAGLVAERIRKAVEEDSPVTVSLGVASFCDGMEKGEELLEEADKALYRAKHNGRNRVEVARKHHLVKK
ncbi:MAG TPA: diguanylate cyclase [Thermodesulfobacteriota bacterium]|nr:diguanylate cyclase [Thermodesulfobacteriota bacterium]